MRKRAVLILILALVAGGLLVARRWHTEPPRVSGFIEADDIRLGSRVGGRVAQVHVEEGDRVEKGKILVELEPFDIDQREAEARANLAAKAAEHRKLVDGFRPEEKIQARQRYEQFKSQHERLKTGPRPQEIAAARAQEDVAEAQLELTKQTYARTMELAKRNAATQDEVDRATEELKVAGGMKIVRQKELELLLEGTRKEDIAAAEAQMSEAKAAWDLTEKGYRKEDVDLAKAAVEAAEAALNVVLEQKKELKITAPMAGVIESLDLQPGDLVAASAPVMSMLDTGRLWVRAYLPEDERLEIGQRVPVSVDAFPGEFFTGEVTFISRDAEFTPNNVQTPEERSKQVFRIKVTFVEGLDRLRAGMAADVWLPRSEAAHD